MENLIRFSLSSSMATLTVTQICHFWQPTRFKGSHGTCNAAPLLLDHGDRGPVEISV